MQDIRVHLSGKITDRPDRLFSADLTTVRPLHTGFYTGATVNRLFPPLTGYKTANCVLCVFAVCLTCVVSVDVANSPMPATDK